MSKRPLSSYFKLRRRPPVNKHDPKGRAGCNKYLPHQGEQEKARRAKGVMK